MSGDVTNELNFARALIDLGIPVFCAPPDAAAATGYRLPHAWQDTKAHPDTIEPWRPGWALCAVGGHGLDFLDVDPRNGGDITAAHLRADGYWPREYAVVATPSGGTHHYILSLDMPKAKRDGIDLQAGAPDGTGRGFVFLPGTRRLSKVDGVERGYHLAVDNLQAYTEVIDDDSGWRLRSWISEKAPPPTTGDVWDQIDPGHDTRIDLGTKLAHGEHQEWLFKYACSLRARGVPAAEAEALVNLRGARDCTPPWAGPQKAWDAVKHAYTRYEAGTPLEIELAAAERLSIAEKVLTTKDLEALPPPRPLVEGFLFRDTLAWISAAPGSYKTILSLHFAACVALGIPCTLPNVNNGAAVDGGGVLYVSGEGASGLFLRIQAWMSVYGGGKWPPISWLPEAVQVTGGAWAELCDYVRDTKPALIVLDTQSRMTVGLDENEARSASTVVNQLDRLRRAAGSCVLVNHHSSKAGMTLRGSSVLEGAADTIIALECPDENDTRVVVRCAKQKEAAPFKRFVMSPRKAERSIVLEKAASDVFESKGKFSK